MDRIIRANEVAAVLGVHKRTIYRWIKSGDFPKPLRLATNATGWRQSTIEAWLDSRPEAGAE